MRTILGFLTAVAFLPALVLAATPTAFTERSTVIATGEEIHLYGLPTKDSTGKTRYFDVTITLDVNGTTGKPAAAAVVGAVRSPVIKTSEFVPGSYPGSGGEECTLVPSAFAGRTEFDLHCVNGGNTLTATWYTGPIAGHPLEAQLTAAGLDTLPGHEEFAWGRVGFGRYWFGSCFFDHQLFAARQIGTALTLTNYGNDTAFDCQTTLFKAVP